MLSIESLSFKTQHNLPKAVQMILTGIFVVVSFKITRPWTEFKVGTLHNGFNPTSSKWRKKRKCIERVLRKGVLPPHKIKISMFEAKLSIFASWKTEDY